MNSVIYLDHAATTPVSPGVRQAMEPWLCTQFGNPSTLYAHGTRADEAVQAARGKVAAAIGARPREIVFTSGGTESINLALKGVALERGTGHVILSAVEHSAVRETCAWLETQGISVTTLPVDTTGLVDPGDVAKTLRDDTILVSIMHANNEIGTIEPVEAIGEIVANTGALFHVDAVQTVGHLPVNAKTMHCDLLSASAHKCYGPKGSGFLYVKSRTRLLPLLHGGGQESERRSGTENVPGIIGLAAAVEAGVRDAEAESERVRGLARKLVDGIRSRIDGVRFNGHAENRLPGHVHVSFQNAQGEALVLGLDLRGICVSTGSACSSRSLEVSHVLKAVGLSDEEALASIRFTLGRGTTENEIDAVLEALPEEVQRLRALSPRGL